MRLLLFFVLLFPFLAHSADSWTDGNKNTWILVDIKKSFERAKLACEQEKGRLPTNDELVEAIDYGLADEEVNVKFGAKVALLEKIWIQSKVPLQYYDAIKAKLDKAEEDVRLSTLCITDTPEVQRVVAENENDKELVKFLVGGTWEAEPLPNTKGGATKVTMKFMGDGTLHYKFGDFEDSTIKFKVHKGVLERIHSSSRSSTWELAKIDSNTMSLTYEISKNEKKSRKWYRKY